MKRSIKFLLLTVLFVFVLALSASAANLYAEKPTSETPTASGWCIGYDETNKVTYQTNVKWEIYGTTLYFTIAESGYPEGATVTTTLHAATEATLKNGNGSKYVNNRNVWSGNTDDAVALPWFTPALNAGVDTIVVGDGIKGFIGTAFMGMTTVKTVELPATSLTFYDGAFKGCSALSTVYQRGSEPVVGTVNLSGVTDLFVQNWSRFAGPYGFSNCASVEKYIFGVTGSGTQNQYVDNGTFNGNSSLKSITLASNTTEIRDSAFKGCTSLEKINVPATVNVIADNAFDGCPSSFKMIAPVGSFAYSYAEANGHLSDSLWDNKPASGYYASNYCYDYVNGLVKTNIKYELYSIGTAEAPEYILYVFRDEAYTGNDYNYDLENTVLSSRMYKPSSSAAAEEYGAPGTNGAKAIYHPWYFEAASNISTIVIGEGITGLKNATFADMTSVKKIEMPASLTSISGAAFKGMTNLTTVYTVGQEIKEGTINLSNIKSIDFSLNYAYADIQSAESYIFNEDCSFTLANNEVIAYGLFMNNYALKSIDISMIEGVNRSYGEVFTNCTSLESAYLPDMPGYRNEMFTGCTSLKAVYSPVGSVWHKWALTNGYETTNTIDVYASDSVLSAIITFDPKTNHISVESQRNTYWEFNSNNEYVSKFFNAYKPYTESITFTGKFGKINSYVAGDGLFYNFTELESVCIPAGERLVIRDYDSYLFYGCESLTTVYFGDEEDMVKGVADFSGMGVGQGDNHQYFLKYLFYGCSSLERVILPELDATSSSLNLTADTFRNCTSLKSVTIPSTLKSTYANIFATCSSLREIIWNAPGSVAAEFTFSGTKGTVIWCKSWEDADAINSIMHESITPLNAFAVAGTPAMTIEGYQVRDTISATASNGLRTVFSFNENAFAGSGLTLVEYGALSAAKARWDEYVDAFGVENAVLSLSGDEFVTADSTIVKTPIYTNGEYVNKSNHEDPTQVGFKVTIINFENEEQFKAELVSVGYEIWKDEEGNYYVIFTSEAAYGYDSISLYKTTVGMLADGVIGITKDEENPVYNTLMGCAKTEISLSNDKIDGYLFSDPINDGKYVAVYITDSITEVELGELGLSAAQLNTVSDMIFGTNVKYHLPEVDEYWAEQIDERIAALPEGKSFIAFTDTHFQSADVLNPRSTRKIGSLIDYVRAKTGIKTVINLGDPYSDESTIELAEQVYREALEDNFYDVVGTDGLFAVGNHDANYSTWLHVKQNGVEAGDGAFNYLLPDSVIYEYSIKNIENKPGVVFDEKMLAFADGEGDDDIVFSDVGTYTAEQMREEFLAWAKFHYYYDDSANNTRYIVYHSGNSGITETYVFGSSYTAIMPTQLNFIADALKTTPSDYDIVFVCHQLASSSDNSAADVQLFQLLSAYKAGRIITLETGVSNANMLKVMGGADLTFDFTGTEFNGTLFTMSGHFHKNLSYVYQTSGNTYAGNIPYEEATDLSDDAIFYIGLNNDCFRDGTPDGSWQDPIMTMGTGSENDFFIVTIGNDGTITVTGMGASGTRVFKYN